jgi:hypothetical protein
VNDDLQEILRWVLPVIAVLILVLAIATAITALSSALLPMGIIAVIALAAWVWLKRR